MSDKKILGIIGGLGPLATAYFMEQIIEMTDAKTDQEHIEMIVYNAPSVPDRTEHILDKSKPSPLPYFLEYAGKLKAAGATEIAIPCVTAQYYHDAMQEKVDIKLMDGVKEVAEYLAEEKVSKVGILATNGTVKSNLLGEALSEYNIEAIYPCEEDQKKVMSLIYDDVKAGRSADADLLIKIGEKLKEKGAGRVILGCTELSVIKSRNELPVFFLDVLDVMARCCVKHFGKLRPKYERL